MTTVLAWLDSFALLDWIVALAVIALWIVPLAHNIISEARFHKKRRRLIKLARDAHNTAFLPRPEQVVPSSPAPRPWQDPSEQFDNDHSGRPRLGLNRRER